MSSPQTQFPGSETPSRLDHFSGPAGAEDPITEIDRLLAAAQHGDSRTAAAVAHDLELRHERIERFAAVCAREIRPALEAVLQLLERHGGGGVIDEHPVGHAAVPARRLALWMSLRATMTDETAPDAHPYLQFDADGSDTDVVVSTGDSSRGAPAAAGGLIGVWPMSTITSDLVTRALLDILRRLTI